jgi:transposase
VTNNNKPNEKLVRHKVAGLPLICDIIERMGLRRMLYDAVGTHGNEDFPAVETLILLIINLTLGKQPLYELEQWVQSLDSRCLGYKSLPKGKFNDDRFGRALDKLYKADRATLMTRLVIEVVKAFDLKLDRIHNDSTSIKAFGKYPGKTETGFELKHGHSKDHRPDLKQLIYSLSICADGAVPIHQKTYPGNRNDDTTHIETWETLRSLYGNTDFLYVADSKLCSAKQLSYIVSQKGRAVTIVPETFSEVHSFKDSLRRRSKAKHEIWRRPKPNNETELEYYSTFKGTYVTKRLGYRIHWIHSSEKRQRDQASRLQRLRKAEEALMELSGKINIRRLKTKEAIQRKIDAILERYYVEPFIHIDIGTAREERRAKAERGRPSPDAEYKRIFTKVFTLGWSRNITRLHQETQVDGLFPLLCTDHSLPTKDVLQAYKYQPRLEKRFNQLKQIHRGAPLLFKKLERIEATMFAFFIALMVQALIERQVRQQMADREIPAIAVYPEDRDASHPTTAKIMGIFADVSTYTLTASVSETKGFYDELTEVQQTILDLLNIPEATYWRRKQTT